MEKLKMHSSSFVQENIEKLAELFPGCVTESTDEDGNALAACFVKNGKITEDFCKELAKRQPLGSCSGTPGSKITALKLMWSRFSSS